LHCPPAKHGLFVDADTELGIQLCPRRLCWAAGKPLPTSEATQPCQTPNEQSSTAGLGGARISNRGMGHRLAPLTVRKSPSRPHHRQACPVQFQAPGSGQFGLMGAPSLLSVVTGGRSFAAVLCPVISTLRCRGYDARCLLPPAKLG
jgi:hypothetical protein